MSSASKLRNLLTRTKWSRFSSSKFRFHSNTAAFSTLSSRLVAKDNAKAFEELPALIEDELRLIATSAVEEVDKSNQSFLEYLYEVFDYVTLQLTYLQRVFTYFAYGLPMAILAPVATNLGPYFPGLEEFVWDYLMWSIMRLGPTFVKMAQWASTRK